MDSHIDISHELRKKFVVVGDLKWNLSKSDWFFKLNNTDYMLWWWSKVPRNFDNAYQNEYSELVFFEKVQIKLCSIKSRKTCYIGEFVYCFWIFFSTGVAVKIKNHKWRYLFFEILTPLPLVTPFTK